MRRIVFALGIAGVSPAVFGVPPKTFARRTNRLARRVWRASAPVGGTPTGATGTVAIPMARALPGADSERGSVSRSAWARFGVLRVIDPRSAVRRLRRSDVMTRFTEFCLSAPRPSSSALRDESLHGSLGKLVAGHSPDRSGTPRRFLTTASSDERE